MASSSVLVSGVRPLIVRALRMVLLTVLSSI